MVNNWKLALPIVTVAVLIAAAGIFLADRHPQAQSSTGPNQAPLLINKSGYEPTQLQAGDINLQATTTSTPATTTASSANSSSNSTTTPSPDQTTPTTNPPSNSMPCYYCRPAAQRACPYIAAWPCYCGGPLYPNQDIACPQE